jgi:hypothetical protein
MTTATTQEITLRLPLDVVSMLEQAVREQNATPDQIVAEALRVALHPVREEALQNLKSHIQRQSAESEAEVRQHLEARLGADEQDRLTQLLDRNRNDGLTTDERAELQVLFDQIEAIATEKAAAIWRLFDRRTQPDLRR